MIFSLCYLHFLDFNKVLSLRYRDFSAMIPRLKQSLKKTYATLEASSFTNSAITKKFNVVRRKSMRLLVTGVILSFGLSSLVLPDSSLVQAQSSASDTQINAMVEALRLAAPPKSGTKNDGYYSEWRVKPETLKGWSKNCLKKEVTPAQFDSDAGLARQIVSCITRRELSKQLSATSNNETAAVRGVACWWMTGNYTGCDSGFTADYVKKVVGYYQQPGSKPSSGNAKPSTSSSPKS